MINRLSRTVLACIVVWVVVVLGAAQTPQSADHRLLVSGEVEREVKLEQSDLDKLPRRSVVATDHSGVSSNFDGVALSEVLQLAGVKLGEGLRGKGLSLYLVVEARDGYRAVFALPELDPAFTDRVVLLAYKRNGKALGDEEGPLRIVVPGEKRHGRWVRQVRALVIKRA